MAIRRKVDNFKAVKLGRPQKHRSALIRSMLVGQSSVFRSDFQQIVNAIQYLKRTTGARYRVKRGTVSSDPKKIVLMVERIA